MTQRRENREPIKQYLLGDLDDARLDQVEGQLLRDAALQEEISAAEDDLIDEYVAGTLSARNRELFTSYFLSTPERLHKLRLAQTLIEYAEVNDPGSPEPSTGITPGLFGRPSPFFDARRWALGAGFGILLLFLCYAAWEAYRYVQVKQRLARLASDRQAVEQELAQLNKTANVQNSSTLSIIVKPHTIRDSGEMRRAVVTKDETLLQLRLELEEDKFPAYQADIQTEEGVDMFTIKDLRAVDASDGKAVILNLPARILATGDYQIHLSGITSDGRLVTVGTYPFQVVLQ